MQQGMKDIAQYISEIDRDLIDRVGTLFAEVDRAVESFRDLTGIKCPEGCGECCIRSGVETTVVEMMPLALELWKNNAAEYWLYRIQAAQDNLTCAFFQALPGSSIHGRCAIYPLRPLICRLFGFFTVRNKYGKYAYGSCSVIKRKYPAIYEKAVGMLEEINHPSVCTDYSIRMIGLDSMLGSGMLPINRAASAALEKIGYRLEAMDETENIMEAQSS